VPNSPVSRCRAGNRPGSSARAEALRQARRREVYDIVEEELAVRLRQAIADGTFEEVLSRVDRNESDPYGAASEILEDSRLTTLLASERRGS